MSWRVSVRPAAETDIAEARDWYDGKRVGLGDEFIASVANAFILLEETPERFPVYHGDFRRALVDRFPYKVFFRIQGDVVAVFRILHAAREHTWRLR